MTPREVLVPQLDQRALAARLNPIPRVADEARARRRLEDFLSDIDAAEASALNLLQGERVRALLLAIADHSPFLWRLVTNDPARLIHLLRTAPETRLDEVLSELERACEATCEQAELMRVLRRARQEIALLIALADLGGLWSLDDVTGALSCAADVFVRCALRFLLREARAHGRLHCEDLRLEQDCGLVILALGKLGAGELNYSSDVDLVVFYNADCTCLAEGVTPGPFYVRLTQALARLLSDRTSDGYVLRVDLRLRPDPGSTAVAISAQSALNYYEVVGQNWERAAMIKARPIAGDIALGESLLHDLAAFIWRKYFDYAAIAMADLMSMSERRTDRLTNPDKSEGLPAFLAQRPGVESGFMIAHVAAASLVNEARVLAHPASVDNITTSGGKEDHVSMGMTSALKLRSIVDLAENLVAIELLAAAEGLEYRRPLKAGRGVERAFAAVRKVAAPLTHDRALSGDIARVAEAIRRGDFDREEKQS